jgi:EAL domain-containing protein (putative c-di-GMP-specific phosphodiesterase class I)
MGLMDNPKRRKEPPAVFSGEANPLSVAVSVEERQVLDMVAEALEQRRMRLAFQPAVYAVDPEIPAFYEGLIRILDPRGRVIPARDFMEVAETRQLGRDIDCAALQMGLQTASRNPGVRVAVNLSARSIGYRPWMQTLTRGLAAHPGIGRSLILEINEETAVAAPDVTGPFLADMRAQGIVFCLDDFGASLTSVPLLAQFRFELCKIDGQFVRGIGASAPQQATVRALAALARELKMFLVAESVETAEEAEFLGALGVGVMQGYLYGAPTVSPDFSAFRQARRR